MITANSPGWNPSALTPAATFRTSWRYWLQVRLCQAPDPSRHLRASRSGTASQVSSKLVRTVLPRAASSMASRSALMSRIDVGNTLLAGGGESLIYVRSRRSIVATGIAALGWAAVFGLLAAGAFRIPEGGVAGVALAVAAAGGAALAVRTAVQLVSWPAARLCFFRDRLLVIQGRHEMRATWTGMGAVTLSEPNSWPSVRLTDRLTIQLKNEPPLVLKPAAFGLAPGACRDLIVRLRDEPKLRAR